MALWVKEGGLGENDMRSCLERYESTHTSIYSNVIFLFYITVQKLYITKNNSDTVQLYIIRLHKKSPIFITKLSAHLQTQ